MQLIVSAESTHGHFQAVADLPHAALFNNLQHRLLRLIQKIDSLLEPFILHECGVSLFRRLHRGMAQQMLNIRNRGVPLRLEGP